MTEKNFGDNLVEKYVDKGKGGFFSKSKSWVLIFTIILAAVLAVLFYNSVIVGIKSGDEIKSSIEIVWHETKWVEKDSGPQEVKIVPAISLKIKNTGDEPLQYVDLQAVFDFEETGQNHSDGMISILQKPLEPGQTTPPMVIKSMYGYSATSKAAFMENKKEWKKMFAKIFARSRGSGLVRIGGTFPIEQTIEGYKQNQPEAKKEYRKETTKALARSLHVYDADAKWERKLETKKEAVIVPTISFTVKNAGDKPYEDLYFRCVFRFLETGEVLSEGITPALSDALAPDAKSDEITVKADFGYSATSIEAFFYNLQKWKQLKANLYVKSKDSNYALLGTYTVKKEIKGVKVKYHKAP